MVVLEHDPHDRECLNAVFRGFHTIKGGAGFLDFVPMVEVCHAAEDRLDAARSGKVPLDAAAFDGAQQALDLLGDMLQAVSSGHALDAAPPALIASLRAGMGATATHACKPVAAASAEAAIAQFAAGGDAIDDLEFEALLDSLQAAANAPAAPAPEPAKPTAADPHKPAK